MTGPVRLGIASTSFEGLQAGGALVEGPLADAGTVSLDPSLFPPAHSKAINLAATVAIVGANSVASPASLQQQLPVNCYGVISTVDLLLDGIVITSNVRWSILVNGAPVPGWSNLTIMPRNGAVAVQQTWAGPTRILIPLGGTVSVSILDVDGGAYTAGAQLYGWFWPQSGR